MDPPTGGDEQERPRPGEPTVDADELGFEPLPMRPPRLRGGRKAPEARDAGGDATTPNQ
jgi:hypothetical protein